MKKSLNFWEPIEYVVKQSRLVKIDSMKLRTFAADFDPGSIKTSPGAWPFTPMKFLSYEDEVDFWFVADAQAFCFWGYPTKWTITYQSRQLDGWWALLVSHQRALEQKTPLTDGRYLAQMDLKTIKRLYKGMPEIPLLKERLYIFNQIGKVLSQKYQGRFHLFLTSQKRDALTLVQTIGRTFAGFEDVVTYKGRRVYLYKKAQLLVGDLDWIANKWHRPLMTGYERLTGEADYKIPALLRSLGILVYSPVLAKKVDTRSELAQGSPEEVEIRANMLWAVHELVAELKARYPRLTPSRLDRILWHMSQDKHLLTKPYHLTRTVNY